MLRLAPSRLTEKRRPRCHKDMKFNGVRLDVIESRIVAKTSSSHNLNSGGYPSILSIVRKVFCTPYKT